MSSETRFKYRLWDYDLQGFVRAALDGRGYDIDEMEAMKYTTENLVAAFGRLLGVLAARNQLTKSEIYEIVRGYGLSNGDESVEG